MKKIYIYPSKLQRSWKTISLCLLTSVCCLQSSLSQTAPGIEWQNTIGGNGRDELNSLQQTTDGGYILSGVSRSQISGDKTENCNGDYDYWIVKTGATGTILWQNTIGGNDVDLLYFTQQTSDGGYILGGYSYSNSSGDKTENSNGGYDYWIVKTDSSGTIQWQNSIGGGINDGLSSIHQTTDGGYILGGYSYSNISGDKTENSIGGSDYWIVKTDSSGTIQWQHTIGGSDNDYLFSLQPTADAGYILGGYSWSDSSGDKTENSIGDSDYWIVKTDSLGDIQWQNTIGGSDDDLLQFIQQTADGGYFLSGYSFSNSSGDKTENSYGLSDYWIVKTDASGNIQWQNNIGGNDADFLYSTQQTSDGGYILGGYSYSNISGDKAENNWDPSLNTPDYWIVKTDTTGNILWQNTIGGSDFDALRSTLQTSDGGYILGGYSNSIISGDKTENSHGGRDYWIVKLYPDTITGIPNYQLPITNYQFSPNPLTTQSKLTFKNPNKEKFLFTLYDITGRITESVSTTSNKIILTKGSKQPGVYLFNLMNEKTGERWNGKIIIAN